MEAPRPPTVPVSPPSWRRRSDLPPHIVTASLPAQPPSHPRLEQWRTDGQRRPDSVTNPIGVDGGIKYETDHTERAHVDRSASIGASATVPALSSPAGSYPGPPPPYSSSCYSKPAPAPSSFPGQMAYSSPPNSRRDSGEECPPTDGTARQALPSISEALARLPGMSPAQRPACQAPHAVGSHYTSHPHTADQQTASDPYRYPQHNSTTGQRNSVGDVRPPVTRPYSPIPRHNSADSGVPARQLANGGDVRSPAVIQHQQHRMSMSSQTMSPVEAPGAHYMSPRSQHAQVPAPKAPYYTTALPSPQQGSNPSLSARSASGSFPPIHSQTSQAPHVRQPSQTPLESQQVPQPAHSYSFPPPTTSGLTYEESLRMAASNQQQQQAQQQAQRQWPPNPEFEKVEEQRAAAAMSQGGQSGSYAVTVKRHLDDFDVENNLNDLAERTGRILNFSRQYGIKAHQYPRSPIPITELPRTEDCDRMIDEAIALRTALMRLKRAVEQQNQLAEQTAVQQGMMKNPGVAGQPYNPEGVATVHGMDKGGDKGDASAGGFAGGDAKKRRGRNAPPGRCHSCNRVETPEWRRGPDGARTLCNACGLHYAKLTRKLNSGKESKIGNDVSVDA